MPALRIELDNKKECPLWFTKTDSELFCNYLYYEYLWETGNDENVILELKNRLNLDVTALVKVAGQELDLEEYMEWAENEATAKKEYEEAQRRNNEAWQEVEKVQSCLNLLINKLEDNPEIYKKSGIEDPYFLNNLFLQDLKDLLKIADWSKENGAKKIRLVLA